MKRKNIPGVFSTASSGLALHSKRNFEASLHALLEQRLRSNTKMYLEPFQLSAPAPYRRTPRLALTNYAAVDGNRQSVTGDKTLLQEIIRYNKS
jgi:hypothetical protein